MKRFLFAILLWPAAISAFAQDAPLPPRVAAMKMTLPDGFKATLFAGEPDVVQPIAFCFDDRGRLWVAECLSYPNWQPDPKGGKDRIVIFEEGPDGAFSKRTVFADNIQNISGITYGFGGVWVCATPNLLFIPIKEERIPRAEREVYDTKPAGPPEIVLDGWSLKAGHNVFNSLTWGPDGWLYGCNGILATSRVGRPGTPDKDRVPINCGVWRYHPTKKKFEAVAHGTTNPWGLDFDQHGEMFITNCVIDHLWHVVPGAHYQRMYGEDLNPHVYKLMPSICDHIHWGGGSWTSSRAPLKRAGSVSDGPGKESVANASGSDGYAVHSGAGGGHAHVGCMIYLGDNWPDRYRGGVFMCNLHGNRINHDILERNGSTYVARHAKDFMFANDPWFRGLALQYGPDGGVYISDWTDTGECHNYKVVDRTNGRIFKITYGDVKPWKGDLAKLSDLKLAKLQFSKNEWMVRHARRLLHERRDVRPIDDEAIRYLAELFNNKTMSTAVRLRALWASAPIDRFFVSTMIFRIIGPMRGGSAPDFGPDPPWLRMEPEEIQAWVIRLLADQGGPSVADAFQNLAIQPSSPRVRLTLLSVSKKLDDRSRRAVVWPLLAQADDSRDPYLPLMSCYAMEGMTPFDARTDNQNLAQKIRDVRTPLVRQYLARQFAKGDEKRNRWWHLFNLMKEAEDPLLHRDILRGMGEELEGRRRIKLSKPMATKTWTAVYPLLIESPLPEVRERALDLAVQFGDERAFTLLRKIVPDRAQPVKERELALKTLLFQQKADLVPVLHHLLDDGDLRSQAIRGLAAFDDPSTPMLLLKNYPKWSTDEKSDAVQTLSARPWYALALLDAIDAKAIPRADVNSYTVRQLQALKSPEVSARLTKIIGEIRPASQEKAKLMAKYKAELKPDVLKKANMANGRALYAKSCANCHRLFGDGGDIGPDLTGSQRTNLDYVLENVLDPSAIVPKEYQVTVVVTKAGRTLSGLVKKESDQALTLQLPNEVVVVPKGDIDTRTPTKVSMMPDGIFEQMRLEEVRDLVAYLASPSQVPLKK
jgi:putative membrane-bound dehydrogenase-like protein